MFFCVWLFSSFYVRPSFLGPVHPILSHPPFIQSDIAMGKNSQLGEAKEGLYGTFLVLACNHESLALYRQLDFALRRTH